MLLPPGPVAQAGEQRFRDELAAGYLGSDRHALLDVVARHHCLPVMRQRAVRFASGIPADRWILDLGIGWGWHWEEWRGPARIVGLDMSLGNLTVARRLLGDASVVLLCADASALPLRDRSIAGAWSVQMFQHLPEDVASRAKRELDRVLMAAFRAEFYDLNPAPLLRLLYRCAGHRLHRRGSVGPMDVNRRSLSDWRRFWRDFRAGAVRVGGGYSELFFHPDLRLLPRRYPEALERVLSRRAPRLAGLIARQLDVSLEGSV